MMRKKRIRTPKIGKSRYEGEKTSATKEIDGGAESGEKRAAKQFRKLNHLNRINVFTVKDKETKRNETNKRANERKKKKARNRFSMLG